MKANTNDTILKYSLLTCAGYFVCMAIAHFFSIKLPILFIYYDVPFYAYQDKIISFAVITYVILFFAAYQNRALAPHAILSLFTTVIGLSFVNSSDALNEVINGASTSAYWLQTAMISGLVVWLSVFYIRAKNES